MKYGLIGKTLVHSYSKEIHEALGKYSYRLFSLSEEEMTTFISKRDFNGLNVTIPYKKDVMALCDEISPLASSIGAVNTLYWSQGKLIGHNTDYEGFLYAAARAEIDFAGKTVLILGSGGTSLMAQRAAADKGATMILKASRNPQAAADATSPDAGTDTASDADSDAGTTSGSPVSSAPPLKILSYDELPAAADSIDIIVNTTPVGTFPNNMESVISLVDFRNCRAVIDVIYNPFRTKLLLEAEKLGLKYTNGLPMLVAQATAAAGYFLGNPGSFAHENERIIAVLEAQMRNIVIVGMPGCGKSTIGRLLAVQLGKTFVDMDEEIEKSAGISIPEIFAAEGEDGFRRRETETAEKLGKERGLVIATGGGAVLRPQNMDFLRQNALVLHVERPLADLAMSGRPLSKDETALKEIAAQRMPIYRKLADLTFDNSVVRTDDELAAALSSALSL